MFCSALPAVRSHLLVRGHVGCVVYVALLALVHGLVGLLLVSPAEAKTSPEPSWRWGWNDRGDREKHINLQCTGGKKKRSLCRYVCGWGCVYAPMLLYVHISPQLCSSIYGRFSVLANTSTQPDVQYLILHCAAQFYDSYLFFRWKKYRATLLPNSFPGYHTQTLNSHFPWLHVMEVFLFCAYTRLLETGGSLRALNVCEKR